MKKLILLMLLTLSMSAFAQKEQIVRDYSIAITVSPTGVKSEWFEIKSRIIFNHSNQNDKIKIFVENDVYLLTQISATLESVTIGGMGYYQLELKDNSGEIIFMQVFKNEIYGVRMVFDDLSVVQVTN